MIVWIHVSLAIVSLISSTAALIKPSKTRLNIVGSLIAATLASGTYLAVATHADLSSACGAGLTYLGITLPELWLAHKRLTAN